MSERPFLCILFTKKRAPASADTLIVFLDIF